MEAAVKSLLVSYHELNPATVDEFTEAPSPLEFMRYVALNRPFIVRGGISDWPAMSWNVERLVAAMGSSKVEVACTPSG